MNGGICILVSYLKEIQPFLDLLSDLNKERKGKYVFYKGTLAEKQVQILQTPEVEGKTLSSLIKGTSFVISAGICGALIPSLSTGDIVISEIVFLYKKTPSDKTTKKPENQSFQSLKIPAGNRVYEKIEKNFKDKQFLIDKGPTITSDFALQNADSKKVVNMKISALSVDMEDFYRLRKAKKLGIPHLSIRAVFDELHDEVLPRKAGIHPFYKEKLNISISNLAVALQTILVSGIL
jgi:nucleoside phosphorylase